jgi:periplasmic divalent cation tolerance protein
MASSSGLSGIAARYCAHLAGRRDRWTACDDVAGMAATDSHALVLTTAPSRDEANAIADILLERRLAACVQFVAIDSAYVWQGDVVREPEVLLIVKTRAELFDEIVAAVLEAHSYDVPEVVLVPVQAGLGSYLTWIDDATT